MDPADVFILFGKLSQPRAAVYVFTGPGADPNFVYASK
jgi:hypothetical protein